MNAKNSTEGTRYVLALVVAKLDCAKEMLKAAEVSDFAEHRYVAGYERVKGRSVPVYKTVCVRPTDTVTYSDGTVDTGVIKIERPDGFGHDYVRYEAAKKAELDALDRQISRLQSDRDFFQSKIREFVEQF